jgi:hypothetical protein
VVKVDVWAKFKLRACTVCQDLSLRASDHNGHNGQIHNNGKGTAFCCHNAQQKKHTVANYRSSCYMAGYMGGAVVLGESSSAVCCSAAVGVHHCHSDYAMLNGYVLVEHVQSILHQHVESCLMLLLRMSVSTASVGSVCQCWL